MDAFSAKSNPPLEIVMSWFIENVWLCCMFGDEIIQISGDFSWIIVLQIVDSIPWNVTELESNSIFTFSQNWAMVWIILSNLEVLIENFPSWHSELFLNSITSWSRLSILSSKCLCSQLLSHRNDILRWSTFTPDRIMVLQSPQHLKVTLINIIQKRKGVIL